MMQVALATILAHRVSTLVLGPSADRGISDCQWLLLQIVPSVYPLAPPLWRIGSIDSPITP